MRLPLYKHLYSATAAEVVQSFYVRQKVSCSFVPFAPDAGDAAADCRVGVAPKAECLFTDYMYATIHLCPRHQYIASVSSTTSFAIKSRTQVCSSISVRTEPGMITVSVVVVVVTGQSLPDARST